MMASGEIRLSTTTMRRMPVLAQSQQPHKYVITRSSNCSAANTFNQFLAPGASAPGAPAAQEGITPLINLPGLPGYGPNPISQDVNSSTGTITNTTLPGHMFYPGTVVIQVTPSAGDTSNITITGTGTGNDPGFNDLVGEIFFWGNSLWHRAFVLVCSDISPVS